MKKGLKRTLVGVMSAAVIAGIVPVNALALTKSAEQTHDFLGHKVDIRLDVKQDRASASTSAAADKVEAIVELAYISNGTVMYVSDSNSSYNATIATAVAEGYRPYSKYAKGTHKAEFYIEGTPRYFDHDWKLE